MTIVNIKGTNTNTDKETVKFGTYFLNEDGELYVLARVDFDLCCLINALGGTRWTDAIEIDFNDSEMIHGSEITQEYFQKVCGGYKFTEVKSVNITYEL